MNNLKELISLNKENKSVLDFLDINTENEIKLYGKPSGKYFYHEGLNDLWDKYGKDIPDVNKQAINDNGILVNLDNGEIFAFIFGRYNFAIKADFDKLQAPNSDELRYMKYMNGIGEDIRSLGSKWVLGIKFLDLKDKIYTDSYKKYGCQKG